MELLILGLALGVGAAKRKEVTKAVVKGYMTVSEKTREVTAHLKEDMRDAVEEARYEQDLLASDTPIPEMDHATERVVLHEEASAAHKAETTVATAAAATVEVGRKAQMGLFKGLAKSYLAMTEKTRSTVAQMREEMRDAIEEARFEREQAAAEPEIKTTEEAVSAPTVTPEVEIVTVAPAKRRGRPAVKPAIEVVTTAPVKRRGRVAVKPAIEVVTAAPVKRRGRVAAKPEVEIVASVPAKRRGRPAAKPAVEVVDVKTPRRSKTKPAKDAQAETPAEHADRVNTAVEIAEVVAAVL